MDIMEYILYKEIKLEKKNTRCTSASNPYNFM